MTTYHARLMDADSGSEGAYDFEERDDLLDGTPVRVVRAFFEYIDRAVLNKRYIDYEINAAFKSGDRGVVTCMGSLHLKGDEGQTPFLLMISRKGRT